MSMESTPPEDIAGLYRRAFAEPSPADALAITQVLRTHGRMDGRRLAERIEALCRAHR
jgi:hypothetical protein